MAVLIATGAYSGYSPIVSGTVGTLVAIPVVVLWTGSTPLAQLAIACLFLGAGVWAAGKVASDFGGGDPSEIVADEIAGYLFAMIAIPTTWPWLLAGFFVFRGFDIVKPFPISWIDREMKGAWGVMLDDVLAGIFTNAVLHLILRAMH